jgi:Fe-S cluster assembly ATPase SufC
METITLIQSRIAFLNRLLNEEFSKTEKDQIEITDLMSILHELNLLLLTLKQPEKNEYSYING